MISGYSFECGCGFEFCSGHSHHTGAANALCVECEARYCLPTKHAMGPEYDELIELHRLTNEPYKVRGRKKHEPHVARVLKPTGQVVWAARVAGEKFAAIEYVGVDELQCVACEKRGSIALGFDTGALCPRCKSKPLRIQGLMY
jgi:hypothetical protein